MRLSAYLLPLFISLALVHFGMISNKLLFMRSPNVARIDNMDASSKRRMLAGIDMLREEIDQNTTMGWHTYCETIQKPTISNSTSAYEWTDKKLVKDKIHQLDPTIRFAKEFTSVGYQREITDDLLSKFPKEGYMMKATHVSGGIILVRDGIPKCISKVTSIGVRQVTCPELKEGETTAHFLRRACKTFLRAQYGADKGELWYLKLKPRCMFEEVLNIKPTSNLRDFKFHFMNGEPVLVQVDATKTPANQLMYATHGSFTLIPSFQDIEAKENGMYTLPTAEDLGPKPKIYDKLTLDAMTIAKAVNQPYVRVDFFVYDDDNYAFAEVTFAHDSCKRGEGNFRPLKYERYLGFVQTHPEYRYHHEDILLL